MPCQLLLLQKILVASQALYKEKIKTSLQLDV